MTSIASSSLSAKNPIMAALAGCRGAFLAIALFSLFINLLMLTTPLYMMQIFDRVLASRSMDTLLMLTLMAGIALAVLAGLDMVRGMVMIRIGSWIERRLGDATFEAGIGAALHTRGSDGTRPLRDLAALRGYLSGPTAFPVLDAPWMFVLIGVIFMLHPALGWVAVSGAILLFFMALVNDLATRSALQQGNEAHGAALQHAEAATRNADAVEAMGMAGGLATHWRAQAEKALALQTRASARGTVITSLSRFFRLAFQAAILGVGASLVLADQISPGAMMAGAIIMSRALAPVEQAIGTWRAVISARESYRRLSSHLANAPARNREMEYPTPKGRLTVEAMFFAYPGAREALLKRIEFGLEPGESLGLIGPTSTGKTTLARLIVGNFVANAGDVRLDGIGLAGWDSASRGPHIGYLPQDVELFAGTVRRNIARMGEGESDDVIRAARQAGVHDLILHLPDGYETEIGDHGAQLSGGARQRIALARALYGNPRLVVLDEPNANLDSPGEEALVEAIRRLKENGVTVVVITHRPSILRNVDKILELRDGAIARFGLRDQIMQQVAGPAQTQLQPQQIPVADAALQGGPGE